MNDLNAIELEIVFMRFLCVVFGLRSSPFLLGGTLQHHIKRYQPDDPAFVEKLLKSLYVDDLINGSNSVKEAFELFLKSKACLSEASFHLRKLASSGKELMSLIHMSEATQAHDNPIQSRVAEDQSTLAKLSVGQLEVAEENIASLKLKSKNTLVLLSVPDENSFPSISTVIDASSYSSYHRLLNVTVYVL